MTCRAYGCSIFQLSKRIGLERVRLPNPALLFLEIVFHHQFDPMFLTVTKQAAYLAEHPGLKSLVDVIELIAGLYRIEKKCGKGKLDPQEIREAREKEAVPLFCQLTKHVEKMRDEYPPSGKAGQAVKYFLSRKESLSTYLKDGEIPIDHNKAERTVKPFVIARKGFDLRIIYGQSI